MSAYVDVAKRQRKCHLCDRVINPNETCIRTVGGYTQVEYNNICITCIKKIAYGQEVNKNVGKAE
jgi:hypothetical protein